MRMELGEMVTLGLPMDPKCTAADMQEAINSFTLRAGVAVSGSVGCAVGHRCGDAHKGGDSRIWSPRKSLTPWSAIPKQTLAGGR